MKGYSSLQRLGFKVAWCRYMANYIRGFHALPTNPVLKKRESLSPRPANPKPQTLNL